MSKLKVLTSLVILICLGVNVQAQKSDSTAKKGRFIFKLSSVISNSKTNKSKKVDGIVTDASKVAQGTIGESLSQVARKTTLSVMAGVNFSKQSVSAAGYTSNFNYNVTENNNDLFKPGFFAGARIDGSYHQLHDYSLAVSVNKLNTGVGYTTYNKIAPYMGRFTSFKGEDNLLLMNVAAHYKKLIPIGDRVKYQLYVVAGPSVDINIGGASIDNQVNDVYKKIFLKGDIGVELNNRTNYNLFFHYHQSLSSLTGASITTSLNSFEFGLMSKVKDLF
jgi:hypothetical protein